MYRRKVCQHCRKGFFPASPNQQSHEKCRAVWRRKYMHHYMRDYQRKTRQELKRDWEAIGNHG